MKNLFVADAAPFVSNPDKNPTLTIVRAGVANSGISGGGNAKGECVSMANHSRAKRILAQIAAAAMAGPDEHSKRRSMCTKRRPRRPPRRADYTNRRR